MNERIRELMIEAGIYECDDFEPHPTFEKFAELIVRECVGVADHSNVNGKSIIGQRIKEHFGVEE
jgi:hypothetical protein